MQGSKRKDIAENDTYDNGFGNREHFQTYDKSFRDLMEKEGEKEVVNKENNMKNQASPPSKQAIPNQPHISINPSVKIHLETGGPWQDSLTDMELHLLKLLQNGIIKMDTSVRELQEIISPRYKCGATTLGLCLKRVGVYFEKGKSTLSNGSLVHPSNPSGTKKNIPETGNVKPNTKRFLNAQDGKSVKALATIEPTDSMNICARRNQDANALELLLSLLPLSETKNGDQVPEINNNLPILGYALPPPRLEHSGNVIFIGVIDGFSMNGFHYKQPPQLPPQKETYCGTCQPLKSAEQLAQQQQPPPPQQQQQQEQTNEPEEKTSGIPDPYKILNTFPSYKKIKVDQSSKKVKIDPEKDRELFKVIVALTQHGIPAFKLIPEADDTCQTGSQIGPETLTRFVKGDLIPELFAFYSLHNPSALEDQPFLAVLDYKRFVPNLPLEEANSEMLPINDNLSVLSESRDVLFSCGIGSAIFPSHDPSELSQCALNHSNLTIEIGVQVKNEMYGKRTYSTKKILENKLNLTFTNLYNHDLRDFFTLAYQSMETTLTSLAQFGIKPRLDLKDYLPYSYLNLSRNEPAKYPTVESTNYDSLDYILNPKPVSVETAQESSRGQNPYQMGPSLINYNIAHNAPPLTSRSCQNVPPYYVVDPNSICPFLGPGHELAAHHGRQATNSGNYHNRQSHACPPANLNNHQAKRSLSPNRHHNNH